MPHVELSLSDPYVPRARMPVNCRHGALDRWGGTVNVAAEPCLILDAQGVIHASSPPCRVLFGLADGVGTTELGRRRIDELLQLVDFTAARDRLADWELERIPPLLAISTGGLARGLLRFRVGEVVRTVDAVATPLFEGQAVIGSLTFFSRI